MIKQFVWLCALSSALAYRITDNNEDDYVEEDVYASVNCNISHPCVAGWKCPGEEASKCQIDEDSCMKYYNVNAYKKTRWRPNCRESDGAWEAKQCKGDRCFCYDDKGKRIFGQAFANQAADMTCACSRKQLIIEEIDALNRNSPFLRFAGRYCDDMGNYHPLQCFHLECWCVEPGGLMVETGGGMDIVHDTDIFGLPCYKKTVDDKEEHAGACNNQPSTTHFLKCLYRGSFVSTKIENGIVFCVWRDKTISGYSANLTHTDVADIDCNCARDTKLYEEVGRPLLHTCLANGNYNPVQRDGDYYYCVDRDGFRTSSKEKEELTAEDCSKISKNYEVK